MSELNSLSQSELKSLILTKLNDLANLRKESKQLRSRLSEIRSAMHATQFEMRKLEAQLESQSEVKVKVARAGQ